MSCHRKQENGTEDAKNLRQHEISKSLDWFWFRESMKDMEDLGRVKGAKKKKRKEKRKFGMTAKPLLKKGKTDSMTTQWQFIMVHETHDCMLILKEKLAVLNSIF